MTIYSLPDNQLPTHREWGFPALLPSGASGVGRCCCSLCRSNCRPALWHGSVRPPLPLCPPLQPRYLGPSAGVPAQPAPGRAPYCTCGQWGCGTGLLEAEGGVAGRRTSQRCECGSWIPAPARGPMKCVCFLLACACNTEELTLNVKVPLDCLSFSLIPAMSL